MESNKVITELVGEILRPDREPQTLPLELGKRGTTIYLWRLIGFFLTYVIILTGAIIWVCFWKTFHMKSLLIFDGTIICAMLIAAMFVYSAVEFRNHMDRIPMEVRLVLSLFIALSLAAPAAAFALTELTHPW